MEGEGGGRGALFTMHGAQRERDREILALDEEGPARVGGDGWLCVCVTRRALLSQSYKSIYLRCLTPLGRDMYVLERLFLMIC